jgi:hypothetical protein
LFELFLPKIIFIPPRSLCHASTTGIPPAPPHMCFFCRALIFQIYLNYFLPKIIFIPPAPCAMTRLPACPRRPDICANTTIRV